MLRLCLIAILMWVDLTAAAAQEYPSRLIKVVVPYPAGGTTDIMARLLQDPLTKLLGQPLVIENRPGAASIVGTLEVARSPADGYTLLIANNGVSIAPLLQRNPAYDATKVLAGVSRISRTPLMVFVSSTVPATDLAGFIAYAKSKPEGLLYGSAGTGSLGHLASELFARMAGVKMVHLPYRGQGPSSQGVYTGEVAMLISTSSDQMNGFIQEGKVRLLGVSSLEPSPLAPDAPPIAGTLPGYEIETWFGILAAKDTPSAIIAKLNAALTTALSSPDIKRRFFEIGVEAAATNPQEFDAMVAAEGPRWQKIIAEKGLKSE
jgi:tripartite-type tricarboxylate transporter receptor subunit TctC